MKKLMFTLLTAVIAFAGITSTASAALFTECGWGNGFNEDGTKERLPNTYGCVIVESMFYQNKWAIAYHSVYIDTYYSENDVIFNYNGTCELKHDLGSLTDRVTGNDRLRKPGKFEDRWFRTQVPTDGLVPKMYAFSAYTHLRAHRADRPSHRAEWRAGGTIQLSVNVN